MKTLLFLLVLAMACTSPAQAQNTQLAFTQAAVVGTTSSQATNPLYVTQAVADGQGNTYVTGMFAGTVSFGASTLISPDSFYELFVAKRDAAGIYLWAAQGGGPDDQQATGLALTAAGDVVVTGSFDSRTASFGSTVLTNVSPLTASLKKDVFVARLSASTHTWQWAVSAGGGTRINGQDIGQAVTVDVFDNLYVAGTFDSSVAFFGSIQVASTYAGEANVFLAKLTSAGQWIWARGQDYLGFEVGGVSTDPYGGVYLTGSFSRRQATFGTTVLTAVPTGSFVATIDGAGTWLWAQGSRPKRYTRSARIFAARSDGRGVYLAGYYEGDTLQLSDRTLLNTSYYDSRNVRLPDAYIARLHAVTGAWEWVVQSAGVGTETFSGPQLDGAGHVLVAGGFSEANGTGAGGATYGATTLRSAAGNDQVVAQLDTAGHWLWTRQANALMAGYGTSVCGLDGQGRGLLLGAFAGATLQLGPFSLAAYPGQLAGQSYTTFTAQLGANGPLAVPAGLATRGFVVFPNPARTIVHVAGLPVGQTVQVLDAVGRLVLTGLIPQQGTLELMLPSGLPAGLYLVRAGARALLQLYTAEQASLYPALGTDAKNLYDALVAADKARDEQDSTIETAVLGLADDRAAIAHAQRRLKAQLELLFEDPAKVYRFFDFSASKAAKKSLPKA